MSFWRKTILWTKREWPKILPFIIVFIGTSIWMFSIGTLASGASGDALDIWKTITSFGQSDMHGSYVLYKGIFSIFPYLQLYRLSEFLGLNEWVFSLLFHALIISYVATLGIPQLAENLFGKPFSMGKRLLLAFLIYYLWGLQKISPLTNLMIDFPRFYFLLLAVNAVFRLHGKKGPPLMLCSIWTGLMVGACFGMGGINSIAGICLILFALTSLIPLYKLKEHSLRGVAILSALMLFLGCLVIPLGENRFQKKVVTSLRESGEYWMPTGESFLLRSLIPSVRLYGRLPMILNNQGLLVLNDAFGEENVDNWWTNATDVAPSFTIKDYFSMVAKYPLEYIGGWANRLFLSVSFRYSHNPVIPLLVSYTLLYLALLTIKRQYGTIKDIFSRKTLIYLAFLLSLSAFMVNVMEPRYGMPLQGLILAAALSNDILGQGFRTLGQTIRDIKVTKSPALLVQKKIPWFFLGWVVFVLVCLVHISTFGSLFTYFTF